MYGVYPANVRSSARGVMTLARRLGLRRVLNKFLSGQMNVSIRSVACGPCDSLKNVFLFFNVRQSKTILIGKRSSTAFLRPVNATDHSDLCRGQHRKRQDVVDPVPEEDMP